MEVKTFNEIREAFYKWNENHDAKQQPLYAVAVASNSNFDREYPEPERAYLFASNSKYFNGAMCGSSIFAYSLQGSDSIRLDWYLREWHFEAFYIYETQPTKDNYKQ